MADDRRLTDAGRIQELFPELEEACVADVVELAGEDLEAALSLLYGFAVAEGIDDDVVDARLLEL